MTTAQSDLQNLYGTLAGRANTLSPTLSTLTSNAPGAADVYKNAFANMNTAQGLSPEALSALRTQGTSGINDQYQSAAQALNTQLLRRGAVGQGALPSSGGDISRAYQPLYTTMEQAKSKAQTNTILADEAAKQASLVQNQTNALSAANSLFGNTGSIFNASNAPLGAAAGVADNLSYLEGPSLPKLFGTSLLSSALSGTSPLFSGGGTNGTGSGGLLGDALGKLGIGGSSGTDLGGYTRQAIDTGGGALKTALSTTGGSVGTGLTGALGSAGNAITGGLGAAGHAAVGLLTNPITAVVGAALVGAISWVKSQAHWEANTWVKGFQNPFDQKMAQAQQQANQLKQSGQMTPDAAAQIQASAKEALDGYLQSLDKFYREKGTNSDQGKVAAQAYQTFLQYYGQNGERYLNQLVA